MRPHRCGTWLALSLWVGVLAVAVVANDVRIAFAGWLVCVVIAFGGSFLTLRRMWSRGYTVSDFL